MLSMRDLLDRSMVLIGVLALFQLEPVLDKLDTAAAGTAGEAAA